MSVGQPTTHEAASTAAGTRGGGVASRAAAAAPVALAAEDVSYAVDGKPIVHGVSLHVHEGEVLALLGPNGAGKSTLLALLAGDLVPGSGRVLLGGVPVSGMAARELARRRAVLPQSTAVAFSFPVRDVIAMGRTPWRGTPFAEDDPAAAAEAASDADVVPLLDRDVTTLSGGEQSRAALARVLAQSTRVLLLDEPTAALDIAHQERVLAIARARAVLGAAVVVVLHDLNLAAGYADRLVLLDGGVVAAAGAAHDVLRPELLSAVYGHPIDVVPHPHDARPLVLPRRLDAADVTNDTRVTGVAGADDDTGVPGSGGAARVTGVTRAPGGGRPPDGVTGVTSVTGGGWTPDAHASL